jgi:Co/Zn/Cd efflux system component
MRGGGMIAMHNTAGRRAEAAFRRVVTIVALANLTYFFIEFLVARRIGSVSLFADSVDFLEDSALNWLILMALGWPAKARARLGMALAMLILIPTAASLWTAWQKLLAPTPPDPWLLSTTGLGALAVNFGCAALLARFRHHGGSLTRAAFLSARNDVLANVAIMAAAGVTLMWFSGWPDLFVGLSIAAMNADASAKVWKAARREHASA